MLLAALFACTQPREPVHPTEAGEPPVTPDLRGITIPSGQLIFQDDFNRADSGWDVFAEAQASATYTEGEYLLRLNQTPLRTWGILRGVTLPADLTLSVTVYPDPDASSGGYGVICRFTDAEHYYFFLLTPMGEFLIGKRSRGAQTGLSAPAFQPSEAILPGNAPNRVTVTCAGDRLGLSINTVPVAEVTDEEFPSGQIGLIAIASEGESLEARFDDVAIYAP